MKELKKKFFEQAMTINELEQEGLISDPGIKNLREALAKFLKNSKDNTPIDQYLFLFANKENYSKEVAQYIEFKLLMKCKKFIEEENEYLRKKMLPSMN